MADIALYEPEIPPNTGNIIRLCANTGSTLHLIKPLAFELDDKRLKRAGLDYREWANMQVHDSYPDFCEAVSGRRQLACSTRGKQPYSDVSYRNDDILLFGPETRGLPSTLLDKFAADCLLRIPMLPDSRSLNLSNAVAVIAYEAWRQQGFESGV